MGAAAHVWTDSAPARDATDYKFEHGEPSDAGGERLSDERHGRARGERGDAAEREREVRLDPIGVHLQEFAEKCVLFVPVLR